MKILYITIITIIVFYEIYLRYLDNNINEPLVNTILENKPIVKNIVKEPWTKIKKTNNNTIFYIKINNFNDENFIKWKNLTKKIDYDIDNNFLIIKTKSEAEALSIANLYISCLNNEIDLNEIVEHNLIELSKIKAKSNNLVYIKLVELIKEGIEKINNKDNEEIFINNYFDTNNMNSEDIINYEEEIPSIEITQNQVSNIETMQNQVSSNIETMQNQVSSTVEPIQNKVDLQIFSSTPIQNQIEPFKNIIKKTIIEAYGGNEYASIFT